MPLALPVHSTPIAVKESTGRASDTRQTRMDKALLVVEVVVLLIVVEASIVVVVIFVRFVQVTIIID